MTTNNRPLHALLLLTALTARARATTKTIKTFTIHHDMGDGWKQRGSIAIDENLTTAYTATDDNDPTKPSPMVMVDSITNISNDGFYKIKTVDTDTNVAVHTSANFCSLRRANFREEISLTLGQSGELQAVSYSPLISPLSAKTCTELPPASEVFSQFTTRATYEVATPAMAIPPVLPESKPYPGLVPLRGKRESDRMGNPLLNSKELNKDAPENQSFLRKYWYVLLPVTLMSLMGGASPEEGAGSAPVQPGRPQRRGKRD